MSNRSRYLSLVLSLLMIAALCVGCSGGSGATAEVKINEIANTEMTSNAELTKLTFDFEDESGNSYTACIAGLSNSHSMTADVMDAVAENIASHFAGGSSARIDGGEDFCLIDAEKFGGKDNSSKTVGTPYGDANLCWAASTADMLVTSGWADEQNEDEILSEFTENYFDDGAFQDTGIKFYFNGMNMDQTAAEKAGKNGSRDAVFISNESSDLFSSTQVRDPGTADGGKITNKGHYNDYAAEPLYSKFDTSKYEVSELAATIMDAIDNDDAVGIDIVFYNGESRVGTHALTACGYIKDASGNLVALVIADSDNDIELKQEYADSAAETLSARAARPDSYDMFLAGSFTHMEKDYITLQDYKFSNPKMKYDNAVIQQIIVLKNRYAADAAPENGGTGDACNTQDIILRNGIDAGLDTIMTASAGDKVDIPFVVGNRSYKGYSAKDKGVVKCKFYIYKDGKKVDEVPFEFALVADSYTTGEANCVFSINASYTFKEAGEYSVDAEVLGVYSGGSKLAEAFTANNYLKDAARITVK